ncbi:MAG: DUF3592 domain-containing protein [Planctomycetota bacterium]
MRNRLTILLLALLLGGGVLWSSWQAWVQHRKLDEFVPVPARVIATQLSQRSAMGRWGTHRSFEPVVTYEYRVEGQTYRSSRVFPIQVTGGETWAQEVLDEFPVDSRREAFVDRRQPSEVFLLRRSSAQPYLSLAFCLLLLGVILLLDRKHSSVRVTEGLGTIPQ